MKLIEQKPNQIIFKAEIEESLANALRRCFNKIPILAIEELEISKNDSPIYDETLAHRVGLVPLKMEKFDAKKLPVLKLSVKKEGMVQSEELIGTAQVVYKKMPLTFLNKGQELEILAHTKIGCGSEHSKFSPGIMFYRNACEIVVDKSVYEEIKKHCPNVEVKEKGNKILIFDYGKQEICDICEGICEKSKKEFETTLTNNLIITIESFGQLETREIFKGAIEELRKDLKEVVKKIK